MINALGLLEVSGLTASIEAADAMLKTAQVRLLSQTITPPGLVTLVIEGDLAACRAALDAGAAAASRLGQVLVKKEIGRPEADTEWFVSSFAESKSTEKEGVKTVSHETITSITETQPEATVVENTTQQLKEPEEVSERGLLAFIAEHPQGRNVTDIIDYFNASRAEIKTMLKECISEGRIHKRGNRYYLVEAKK